MERRVWIDGWQMQCCGDPFRIGQTIDLRTTSVVDREYLGAVIGEAEAATVTDYEDHHDLGAGSTSALNGHVDTIEAVSCTYALQGTSLYPVPGTSHIDQRGEASGWEPEEGDERFVGYLVTLTTV